MAALEQETKIHTGREHSKVGTARRPVRSAHIVLFLFVPRLFPALVSLCMASLNGLEVRVAVESDAPAINDILNHYVVQSTATFITEPQKLADRLNWLMSRTAAHPVVVAESTGKLLGWGALSSFRNRAAYARTAEVSVYIHPDHLRRGIGRTILTDLLSRARAMEYHALIGGCCTESTASMALLEAMGFKRVGHFPQVGRKFDRWLDVAFLQLLL